MAVGELGQLVAVLLSLTLVAGVLGRLFAKWGLPELLGAIAAGVVLGPQLLGVVDLGSMGPEVLAAFQGISAVGLSMLMIIGGLSTGSSRGAASRADVVLLVLASALAFVAALVTSTIFPVPAGVGTGSRADAYHLVLALAAVVTSVPFLTSIFLNQGLLGTSLARTALRVACLVDLGVWSVYPVAVLMRNDQMGDPVGLLLPALSLAAYLVCVGGTARLLQFVRRSLPDTPAADLVPLGALGCVALVSATALDVHIMVASFFFGYSARAVCDPARVLRTGLSAVANHGFIPVYFGAIGAGIAAFTSLDTGLLLGFAVWSSAIKCTAVYVASRAARYDPPTSLIFSAVLNTRGGPGIALAAVAAADMLIDDRTFVALILIAIGTTVITQFVLRRNRGAILAEATVTSAVATQRAPSRKA